MRKGEIAYMLAIFPRNINKVSRQKDRRKDHTEPQFEMQPIPSEILGDPKQHVKILVLTEILKPRESRM
jgi:hypothetical protein